MNYFVQITESYYLIGFCRREYFATLEHAEKFVRENSQEQTKMVIQKYGG